MDDASPEASAPASANVSNSGGNKDREESWALLRRGSPPTLLRQASNVEVQDVQIVSQFWEKFVPTATQAQYDTPCAWLQESIVSQGDGIPLQTSLKALSMTRLGFSIGDTTLTTRGRDFYGHALRQLQNALWDEKLMWDDDIFAAAYILSVYEVSAGGSVESHQDSDRRPAVRDYNWWHQSMEQPHNRTGKSSPVARPTWIPHTAGTSRAGIILLLSSESHFIFHFPIRVPLTNPSSDGPKRSIPQRLLSLRP